MSLQSLSYFAFLPVVAAVYLHLPHKLQAPFLLAVSWLFYLLTAPGLFLVTLGCTLFTWTCGLGMAGPHKKAFFRLGVIGSIVILGFFKYAGLLTAPFSAWLAGAGLQLRLPAIVMPLGISFYTFASIGYLADIAHGRLMPERSFVHYAIFTSFFAVITAGPICRAPSLLPQLHAEHRFDAARTVRALRLYALGLFKKVAVADLLFLFVQPVFADIPGYGGPALVLALVAYAFYLYFDFAGYSEMSRASGILLGIELPVNFRTPFFATNFSGVWSRWHISLSSWLKDYIFNPLVRPERCGEPLLTDKPRRFSPSIGVFVIFFISGMWHGNTLPYLVWGLANWVFRNMEQFLHRHFGRPKPDAPAALLWAKRLVLFTCWTFTLAFFSIGSGIGADGSRPLSDSFALLGGMLRGWELPRFAAEVWQAVYTGFYANDLMVAAWFAFTAFVLLLSFWMDWQCFCYYDEDGSEAMLAAQPKLRRWVLYYLLVLCIFAGMIIQNGGFAGQSFAYAGF